MELTNCYQLIVTFHRQWKDLIRSFFLECFLNLIYLLNMERNKSEIDRFSEFKSTDLVNICRTCLKELQYQDKVSIFQNIDFNDGTTKEIDNQMSMCICDIISLCSTKITVNVHPSRVS